ncbi:cAMP-binding domain of CRP or a regulatory subunit of cAMP-dependent protein kinases [Sphingobium faniae]|nr:cAMP-binding domain of CRP or a regulatory subunit of cAMP-dependent protein kinases [Sphingobium faniae]
MQGSTSVARACNDLLAGMAPQDRQMIWPDLHREELPARIYLERTGDRSEKIYFIESGVISLLETGDLREPIEVGLIGREGMVGASSLVTDLFPQRDSYVQVAGRALVITRSNLLRAARSSDKLLYYLLRYVQTQIAQMSLTVSASVRANVQVRLARKLLMYHDRVGIDDLPLTHENMSIMMGVRRASVTHAIHSLEGEGWIRAQRGLVTIRDRQGLEKYCGPFYGVAERRYDQIMNIQRPTRSDHLPRPSGAAGMSA